MKTPFRFIAKPGAGRRFAISDIHGCSQTFIAILHQIGFTKRDHLYILGDMVNRGPDSAGVLETIISLQRSGYHLYCLMGNHEQRLLNANKRPLKQRIEVFHRNKSQDLLNNKNKLRRRYERFFEQCSYYFELEDYLLVHAGFNFDAEEPFRDYRSMMYINSFRPKKKHLKDKRIVHGHKPQSSNTILNRLKNKRRRLQIDNGCVNQEIRGQGALLCLNLDTLGVFIQPNIEA